jgi:hypothetical protein
MLDKKIDNIKAQAELTMFNASCALAKATELTEYGLLLEKEVGLDKVFGLIRMGFPEVTIADDLGINKEHLFFILTRTKELRQSYFDAQSYNRARKSGNLLDKLYEENYKEPLLFTKEIKRFADHHQSVINHAHKTIHTKEESTGSSVVVNNVISVAKEDDIPELPAGLEGIIDMEETEDGFAIKR